MKIAVVGAGSTGKTQLARDLAVQLRLQGRHFTIDSDLLFEGGQLRRFAHDGQWRYDVTLLMGLDSPWVDDGLQCAGPLTREQVDRQLRKLLTTAGIPFHVVYGQGEARLANALAALGRDMATPAPVPAARDLDLTGGEAQSRPKRWQWSCGKCSDPGCEHRLFTLRPGAAAAPGTAVATSKIDR